MSKHKRISLCLMVTLSIFFTNACFPKQNNATISGPVFNCRRDGQLAIQYNVRLFAVNGGDVRIDNVVLNPSFELRAWGDTYEEINRTKREDGEFNNVSVEFIVPSPSSEQEINLELKIGAESWQGKERFTNVISVPRCRPAADFPVLSGVPLVSCNSENIIFTFQFDQPVSGEFTFHWNSLTLSQSAEEDNSLSFDLENSIEDVRSYMYTRLVFDEGTSVEEDLFNKVFHVNDDGCISNDDEPHIEDMTCLPNGEMMLQFDFNHTLTGEVTGEYEAFVNGVMWDLSPLSSGTALIFTGPAIEGGTSPDILLQILPDHAEYFSFNYDRYVVEACGSSPVELLAPDRAPEIINTTCVGKGDFKQLMVVFEFDQDVIGEYAAFVADIPYELAPVASNPERLYYYGTPPPQGPITIKLVSTSHQEIAYEGIYTPVVCGPQEKKDDDGDGDGGYTPPSY